MAPVEHIDLMYNELNVWTQISDHIIIHYKPLVFPKIHCDCAY